MYDSVRILATGMAALAAAIGLGRFAFTPILPVMQAEYGFSPELGAWLAAANNLGYLLGALSCGWMHSQATHRRMLAVGFVLLAATLALMPASASASAWAGLRFAAGVASAWVFVFASALVVPALTRAGHARWAGVHFGGVGLGIVGAGWGVGAAVETAGADAGWLAAAGLTLLLAGVAWRGHSRVTGQGTLSPDTPCQRPKGLWEPELAAVGGARKRGVPLPLLAAAYFCEGLGYIVTGTFLVAVVRAAPGLESLANVSWIVVGLAALPSAVAWGWLAEHKGYVRTLVTAHLVQAVGVALPALSGTATAVLAGAVLYGGTFLGIVGVTLSFARTISPTHPARTIGWLTVAFGVGQLIGPVVATWIAVRYGWGPALLTAAVVVLAGVPLLLIGAAMRAPWCLRLRRSLVWSGENP